MEKSPQTYNGENDVSILFILAGNNDIHKSLDVFEFGQGQKTDFGVSRPFASKNRCIHFFSIAIDLIHLIHKLAGNKDMHEISDEYEFRPDLTIDCEVSCH